MYVRMYVCRRITVSCDSGVAWESPNRFVVIVAVVVVVVLGDFNPLRICANPIDTRTRIAFAYHDMCGMYRGVEGRGRERHACMLACACTYTPQEIGAPCRGIFTKKERGPCPQI